MIDFMTTSYRTEFETDGGIVTIDTNHFGHAPSTRRPRDKGQEVDGLGDQLRLGRHSCFLNEAAQSRECRARAIGVHRGDATGMACIPGLEQRERLRAANLADDDPVWTRAHRGARQEGQVRGRGCMKLHHVGCVAMQFERVLNDDEALVWISETNHLMKQRVCEGRLTGAGSAREYDVLASGNGRSEERRV